MTLSKEIKIALLAIVAIIALFFGYRFLRGTDLFASNRVFYVYYQDIEGLEMSNPVLLNGLTVGKVQNLELLQDSAYAIRVTIDVDKEVLVGDGTVAHLGSSDLLGSKAIMLQMNPNTRLFEGGETLLSSKKGNITDQLAAEAIPLMHTIDSTVANINSFFTPQSRKSLQNMLSNFESTSGTLDKIMLDNQRKINQITSDVSRLTAAMIGTQRKIDQLAGNLATITDSVKRADMGRVIKNANLAMEEMRSAIAKVDNAQGTLGMLMNDRALYNNMTRATADLDRLLVDFQKNPKRYVHFSVFGKKNKGGDIEVQVDEPGSQMGPNPKYREPEKTDSVAISTDSTTISAKP